MAAQPDFSMIFYINIVLCIACALVTITSFVLYIRARMALRMDEHSVDGPTRRTGIWNTLSGQARIDAYNAFLDKQEERYKRMHYMTLFLFVFFGVVILVQLSNMIP